MAYSLVIPKEFVSSMYKLREAGFIKSIRHFMLIAVEEKLDRYKEQLQQIEENE